MNSKQTRQRQTTRKSKKTRTLSTGELALRYGVAREKVHHWIDSGELRALNVASNPRGQRPRWRITLEAVAAFEQARSSLSTLSNRSGISGVRFPQDGNPDDETHGDDPAAREARRDRP